MDEFSRPATVEDLKLLLRSLNQHGVDYLLIGVTRFRLMDTSARRRILTCWFLPPRRLVSASRMP